MSDKIIFDPIIVDTIASVLGFEKPLKLWQAYAKIKDRINKKHEEERLARWHEGSLKILEKQLIQKSLSSYYTKDMLENEGLTPYRIMIENNLVETTMVTKKTWLNTNTSLCNNNENCADVSINGISSEPNIDDTANDIANMLHWIEQRGSKIWNAPLFLLNNVEFRNQSLKADFRLDKFFNYRFKIGYLYDEIIQALIDTEFNPKLASSCEKLPLRSKYLPNAKAVAAIHSRICAGGVGVLFALARKDDFLIPVQRRSINVSDEQNLIALIPMAFHQPMIDPKGEVNISATVFREIYEELFGGSETEKGSRRIKSDWFLHEVEPLKWFRDYEDSYSMECVSFGLNLISGNYEFAVLMHVDGSYWEKFGHLMMTNWEVSDESGPLISTKSSKLAELLCKPEWSGEALFAFVQGLIRLKELFPDKVELPEIEVLID